MHAVGKILREFRCRNFAGFTKYLAKAFPNKLINRLVLALVTVAVLPMLACHGGGSARAQSDPLNNAYRPTVDCNAADYPTNIRFSGDMDKLMQTSGSPSGLASATLCQTVFGTQNEWVDFQLHVQAPSGGYASLSVSISSFSKTTGPGGNYTIPNTYRQIIPYAERYLDITSPTAGAGNVAYVISGTQSGYVPDVLVPFVDPYYGQITNANPDLVAANHNQSYWFDILIPAAAPAGWYSGMVTVSDSGTTLATMPVILGVWQWPSASGGEMPSTPTLPAMEAASWADFCDQYYGGYSGCSAFPGAGSNSEAAVWLTEAQFAVFLLDHRMSYVSATYPPNASPGSGTWSSNWSWILNGTNPPSPIPSPILSGAKDQVIAFYNNSGYQNPDIQNWLTTFSSNNWSSKVNPFFAPVDEPESNCTRWNTIAAAAAIVHGDIPPGQVAVTGSIEQATACSIPTSDLDIFVVNVISMDPSPSPDEGGCSIATYPYCLDRSSYTKWEVSGSNKIVASYFACSNSGTCSTPGIGSAKDSYYNVNVDGTGVSNRAEEWVNWLHNQTVELYYADTICWEPSPSGCAPAYNPWASILHYGNNGDGTTVYPGVSTEIGSGVRTPFVLPSIRLQLRRDGIQDYEYMDLLNSEGEGAFVTNEIRTWLNSSWSFNNDPVAAASGFSGDIMDARNALGMAVHDLTYPVALQPPTDVTATVY